jgi:hypothetical protein
MNQVLRADNSSLAGDIRKEMKVIIYYIILRFLLLNGKTLLYMAYYFGISGTI